MDRDSILANHVQPERTCTRCGLPTVKYDTVSIDGRAIECHERCIAARLRQDEIERRRMMNPEGNQTYRPRKKPLQFEWVPSYD